MSRAVTNITISGVEKIEVVRSSSGYVDVRFFGKNDEAWQYQEVTAYRSLGKDDKPDRIRVVVRETEADVKPEPTQGEAS